LGFTGHVGVKGVPIEPHKAIASGKPHKSLFVLYYIGKTVRTNTIGSVVVMEFGVAVAMYLFNGVRWLANDNGACII
jgi:hypothetical protein